MTRHLLVSVAALAMTTVMIVGSDALSFGLIG